MSKVKVLVVYPERCMACKLCELACSFHHTETFNPVRSRIKVSVLMEEHFYLPMVCMQCKNAPCAAVCPTNCIYLNADTGAYEVERARCIGCRMCVLACPFGVIEVGRDGMIFKCDHCEGSPECVEICPTKAIDFRVAETTALPTQRAFVSKVLESSRGVMV